MGLDMYITGKKFWSFNAPERKEDGFEIEEVTVKLGYWRKHADLHGLIINNYGPKDENDQPLDDCRPIALTAENINEIITAVKEDKLAKGTTGFFFGESPNADSDDESEQQWFKQLQEETLTQFGHALLWLAKEQEANNAYYYSVQYQASW